MVRRNLNTIEKDAISRVGRSLSFYIYSNQVARAAKEAGVPAEGIRFYQQQLDSARNGLSAAKKAAARILENGLSAACDDAEARVDEAAWNLKCAQDARIAARDSNAHCRNYTRYVKNAERALAMAQDVASTLDYVRLFSEFKRVKGEAGQARRVYNFAKHVARDAKRSAGIDYHSLKFFYQQAQKAQQDLSRVQEQLGEIEACIAMIENKGFAGVV